MSDQSEIELEEQFAQKRMSKQLLFRLMRYLRPYKVRFAINLVLAVLATLCGLFGPRLIQIGIDRFLTNFSDAQVAYRGILAVSAIYLGVQLVGWLLSVIQVKSAIAIGQNAMNDLRLQVFEHVQRLSLNYFDKTHQGRIISRIDGDIGALDQVLTWGANQLLTSLLTLIGVVTFLIQYDWRLCLAIGMVAPLLAVGTRFFHVRVMEAYRSLLQQGSRLTSTIAENISGVRVVQAFAREGENLVRFGDVNEVYIGRFLRIARIFHTYMPFINLVSGLGSTIVIGYGGWLVMQRQITVGELAAFILYLGMFFGPIQTMGDLYNAVLSAAASSERIFHLLDTQPQIMNRPQAKPLSRISGHVVFDHVFSRYDSTPPEQWILKDICFEAKPGETIALVGHTGSGKTSIISLVARFYEPQQGRILVDGINLQDATMESLRSQIGIVTQENFLFTGTVIENLKFGRTDATDEEVIEAAKTLGTHDIIMRLTDGYQTKVSERGSNFSAGERQLITFTRAMVAEPRILILDEATSAVDSHTETIIQHALEKLFERRTSFVVAHRLSTVRHAHQILVLEHGVLVERGTHDELLRLNGRYARLHEEFVRH